MATYPIVRTVSFMQSSEDSRAWAYLWTTSEEDAKNFFRKLFGPKRPVELYKTIDYDSLLSDETRDRYCYRCLAPFGLED